MHILYVEDDDLQFEVVSDALVRSIPAIHVINIRTESQFRSRFEQIAQDPPNLIILDVLLRWADPAPDMPEPPQEVIGAGIYKAGFRCKTLLETDVRTRDIPVIFHTNLLLSDIQPDLAVAKQRGLVAALTAEPGMEKLVSIARSFLQVRQPIREQRAETQHRNQIFVSYSHKDKKWLTKLTDMLKPLAQRNVISTWDDRQIKAGELWRKKIEHALATAKVAVLLVSPNFLASDFIYRNELPPLLEKAKRGGLAIIWLAVSASVYSETELAQYQAVNDPARPLDSLRAPDLNKELVRICQQIKEIVSSNRP